MKFFWAIGFPVLAGLWGVFLAQAQTSSNAAEPRAQVPGSIIRVNAPANQISLKADTGAVVTATITDHTLILHIPPGETDPKKGSKMPLAELTPGDRVVAMGRESADRKVLQTSALLVRTKEDLAEIRRKDLEDWRRRGVTGTVAAINQSAWETVTTWDGILSCRTTPPSQEAGTPSALDFGRGVSAIKATTRKDSTVRSPSLEATNSCWMPTTRLSWTPTAIRS